MKLIEIQTMWEQDCQIDRVELGEESLKIAQLHSKYFKLFSEERLHLKKLELDNKILRKNKFEYYNGIMSQEDLKIRGWEPFNLRVLKSDLNIYLEGDVDVHNAELKYEYQKEKINFLENIIKALNNRNFQIKNAIDWAKFMNGV
jgi:hypothetical protein